VQPVGAQSLTINVNQDTVAIAFAASPTPPVVGQNVFLTVQVTGGTSGALVSEGTVSIDAGNGNSKTGIALIRGTATFETAYQASGTFTATATFSGSTNYVQPVGAQSLTINVNQDTVAIAFAAFPTPLVLGESVFFYCPSNW